MPSFPRVQIIPQPYDQLSVELDGREVLRYHYGALTPKPYWYPVIGPAGRPVTRLTHPHDPHTHAHHLSLWIGHNDVNGANFWEHWRSKARIVHDRIVKLDDGVAATLSINAKWIDDNGKPLLLDERVWTYSPIYATMAGRSPGDFFLDLNLKLTPVSDPVTIGKTPFGLVAVRVAKTMGVNDGEGKITNSEGKVNEKDVLWQRAHWCDYSGYVTPDGEVNGIALFDHPMNPRHPTYFHVRNDGWMGASISHTEPLMVTKAEPLKLRYRFWVHTKWCNPNETTAQWNRWAHT